MSRNAREGRYVGRWQGNHVRFCGQIAINPIIEPFWPQPDSGFAWSILRGRRGEPLLPKRLRYLSKARRAAWDAGPPC